MNGSHPTVEELNERHATAYTHDRRYAGGEVGAERLFDGDGKAYVLKYQPSGLAPQTTARLRSLGYPAPRYVVVAETYCVQEELPGTPLGGWDVPITDRILQLNDLQRGGAVTHDRSWPATIVESVTDGFEEFMVLETLQHHSADARELLARCQAAVDLHARTLTTTDDVVHFDFTPDNVLYADGEVTGVIDWGGTRSGDRMFDLVTWLYYARENGHDLRRLIGGRIGEKGISVYLAHLAIRQADWSIRHHGEEAGRNMVAYGLRLARAFP